MTQKRFILIGCGAMGRRHAEALIEADRAGDLSFAGIYDPSPEGYRLLVENCGEAARAVPYHGDIDSVIHAAEPDGFVIATTAPFHIDYIRLAAQTPSVETVFVEKPLCVSLAEAREIEALAESGGLRIAVNHQWKFIPTYRRLHALANSADFGGVISASIMAGNIGLAMGGSHALYLFQWLAGVELTQVHAWLEPPSHPNPRGAEFEDWAGSARFATADGTRSFYLSCGVEQHHGLIEVWMCRYGHIVVDRLNARAWAVHRQPEHRSAPSFRYGMPAASEDFALPAIDLVASSRDHLRALLRGEGYVNLSEATHIMRLLVAAHTSHEGGGCPVDLRTADLDEARRFAWC